MKYLNVYTHTLSKCAKQWKSPKICSIIFISYLAIKGVLDYNFLFPMLGKDNIVFETHFQNWIFVINFKFFLFQKSRLVFFIPSGF